MPLGEFIVLHLLQERKNDWARLALARKIASIIIASVGPDTKYWPINVRQRSDIVGPAYQVGLRIPNGLDTRLNDIIKLLRFIVVLPTEGDDEEHSRGAMDPGIGSSNQAQIEVIIPGIEVPADHQGALVDARIGHEILKKRSTIIHELVHFIKFLEMRKTLTPRSATGPSKGLDYLLWYARQVPAKRPKRGRMSKIGETPDDVADNETLGFGNQEEVNTFLMELADWLEHSLDPRNSVKGHDYITAHDAVWTDPPDRALRVLAFRKGQYSDIAYTLLKVLSKPELSRLRKRFLKHFASMQDDLRRRYPH